MNESGLSGMPPADAERVELERAVDLIGRDTRPGRLLRHLGEKYFLGQADQLTEFDIATQVFGRTLESFDPADDAVVRVEIHRLRKKLGQIYESGQGPSGLRLSLPAGTYVPQFSRIEEPAPPTHNPDSPAPTRSADPVSADTLLMEPARRAPGPWLLALGLTLLAVVGAGFWLHSRAPGSRATTSAVAEPAIFQIGSDEIVAHTSGEAPGPDMINGRVRELHLLAGYSRSEIIDHSGIRWVQDRYFKGGGSWPNGAYVRGTSRPFIYANWRNGEFTYDIPMAPGIYELRLHFASGLRAGDEKLSGFNVWLNDGPLLWAFDANIDAGAPDAASERVFRDVTLNKDGFVRLRFGNAVSTPMLNGIELVPGIPGRLRPIRLTTQPTSFVDHKGQRWMADDYYHNGLRSTDLHQITGTEDPELFASERYGHFSYVIPVDTRGRYTVVLHFSEIYYGPMQVGGGGVGSRIFHVFCNGRTLLEDFDIYKEAGASMKLVSKTFKGIRPSAQGKIKLTFEPVKNNATVSAIEVLEEPG